MVVLDNFKYFSSFTDYKIYPESITDYLYDSRITKEIPPCILFHNYFSLRKRRGKLFHV